MTENPSRKRRKVYLEGDAYFDVPTSTFYRHEKAHDLASRTECPSAGDSGQCNTQSSPNTPQGGPSSVPTSEVSSGKSSGSSLLESDEEPDASGHHRRGSASSANAAQDGPSEVSSDDSSGSALLDSDEESGGSGERGSTTSPSSKAAQGGLNEVSLDSGSSSSLLDSCGDSDYGNSLNSGSCSSENDYSDDGCNQDSYDEPDEPDAKAKGALSRLFRNMASRKKRGLTDEEILNLVFESDQESDVCDEDYVLLDNGDCETDESGSEKSESRWEWSIRYTMASPMELRTSERVKSEMQLAAQLKDTINGLKGPSALMNLKGKKNTQDFPPEVPMVDPGSQASECALHWCAVALDSRGTRNGLPRHSSVLEAEGRLPKSS
ncbi:hypothetical protein HPB50_027663 [Hyalomma asiaticum]|nr:hypothetical protein HPB50_027663 [Hyalomma asiaticum]